MDNTICPICKNPKKSSSAGRLTQWIVACTCDLADLQVEGGQDLSVSICRECGKRIGEGRSGSFTQFIFRFDICQCRVPSPIKRVLEIQPQKEEDFYVHDEEEPELVLDKAKFPIDRYKALSRLGAGGAGTVFLARDRLLNKLVAVKVLNMSQARQLTMFQEEARATSSLNHPSIVGLLDFGLTESEVPYMVLEHVPGSSLEEFIDREGPMDWRVCRYVFAQICDALDYSHTHGILHRDIKPSNILLFQNENGYLGVKLIDFGIAKIKSEGQNGDQSATMAGAPLYMSPDTGLGRSYDQRSEVYSLGCVLYEALTGKPPFQGDSALQTIVMHAENEAPLINDRVDIEFPIELPPIVAKALAKEPAGRYQSMSELRNALLALEPEPRVGEGTVTIPGPQRSKWLIPAAVVLLGLIWVVSYTTYANSEMKRAAALDKKLGEQTVKQLDAEDKKATEVVTAVTTGLNEMGFHGEKKWTEEPTGYFTGEEVSDEDFKELKDKDVVSVELMPGESATTGIGFRYVVDKPITMVFVKVDGFNDEGAKEVSKITSIRRLKIHFNKSLTSKGLEYIATLPNLQALQLRLCYALPSNTVQTLSKSKTIWNLDLGHSKPISIKDFEYVTKMKELSSICLTNCNLGDAVVPILYRVPNLKVLEIKSLNLSEKAFLSLAHLKKLRHMKVKLEGPITTLVIKKFQMEREKAGLRECKFDISSGFET